MASWKTWRSSTHRSQETEAKAQAMCKAIRQARDEPGMLQGRLEKLDR